MNTKSNYVKLDVAAPEHAHEFIIAELLDHGFDSFEEKSESIFCFIEQKLYTATVEEEVTNYLQTVGDNIFIQEQEILEPRNWNEEWEQNIQPVSAGKFFIRPSWRADLTPPSDAIILEIDPKMAFGTGYHETTRLMLRKISTWNLEGKDVIDVGTGTGVLAIACLKVGAKFAFGFDIDEWSYENASENALLNSVADKFEIKSGSFENVPKGKTYDLVLANLQKHIILENDQALMDCVADKGTLLLSGILAVETEKITTHPLFTENFNLIDVAQEGEWISVQFDRK